MRETISVPDELSTGTSVEFYRSSPFQYTDTAPGGSQTVIFGQLGQVVAISEPLEALLCPVIVLDPRVPQLLELDKEHLLSEETEWARLYAECAEEDRQLAEVGLAHYTEMLREEDGYEAG